MENSSIHLDINQIRTLNPELDEKDGHKAFLDTHLLPPSSLTLSLFDEIVEKLISNQSKKRKRGAKKKNEKKEPLYAISQVDQSPVSMHRVMLYTNDWRPELVRKAIEAGFFLFASEIDNFPDLPLSERCLLNLELCGPKRNPNSEGEDGGRIILDQASKDIVIGKRATKSIRDSKGYRMTWNRAFYLVWETIVEKKGINWMGFRPCQEAYHSLFSLSQSYPDSPPLSSSSSSPCSPSSSSPPPSSPSSCSSSPTLPPLQDVCRECMEPQLMSIELWDDEELISAEIGCLTGSCYTVISLFSETKKYPRCDQVRAQGAAMLLKSWGVNMIDVGTTAQYYITLFGFERLTRREFITKWRKYRQTPLNEDKVPKEREISKQELLSLLKKN